MLESLCLDQVRFPPPASILQPPKGGFAALLRIHSPGPAPIPALRSDPARSPSHAGSLRRLALVRGPALARGLAARGQAHAILQPFQVAHLFQPYEHLERQRLAHIQPPGQLAQAPALSTFHQPQQLLQHHIPQPIQRAPW